MVGSGDTDIGGATRQFPPTSLALLLRLSEPGSVSDEALARIIGRYWKPVYCLIRRTWGKTNEEAKDLTQGFFCAAVLDGNLARNFDACRGSFRSYLKSAVNNYVRDAAKAGGRQKRGGQRRTLSLEFGDSIDPSDSRASPEEAFDRAWRSDVLSRAEELMERRLKNEGKELYLEAFRRYEMAESKVTYRSVADAMGLGAETVKFFLRRCREEYRRAVEDVVSEYSPTPRQVEAEMRELLDL
jgi:RNA polymerase sigma factor (sigma-70 family)